MEFQKRNLTKFCSFYVSDWHLVTMLLPYINEKIEKKAKVATILEKDIEKNITTLLERLNLKNKEEILKINWKKNNKIKNEITNLKEDQEIIILINGNKKFIEKENQNLKKYLQMRNIKNKIKIIDCYEIVEFNGSINQILDEHDKILNTSGEREITDIFEDYEKQNYNEEKKAVI